jgi:hypothetical protein
MKQHLNELLLSCQMAIRFRPDEPNTREECCPQNPGCQLLSVPITVRKVAGFDSTTTGWFSTTGIVLKIDGGHPLV